MMITIKEIIFKNRNYVRNVILMYNDFSCCNVTLCFNRNSKRYNYNTKEIRFKGTLRCSLNLKINIMKNNCLISQRIIDVALSSTMKVSKKHMEQLKTLVNTSQNPTIALELMLGVFEMPNVVDKNMIIGGRNTPCKVINYNPIKEQVEFSYERIRTIQFWVDKKIENPILPTYKELVERNYDHYKREEELKKELNENSEETIYVNDKYKKVYIFCEEKGRDYTDTMNLKTWEQGVEFRY